MMVVLPIALSTDLFSLLQLDVCQDGLQRSPFSPNVAERRRWFSICERGTNKVQPSYRFYLPRIYLCLNST